MHGAGHEGLGEDVTYENADHDALAAAGAVLALAGTWTLASFSDHLQTLDLFPAPPHDEVYRNYRAWAFESAALDLALRQAGRRFTRRSVETPPRSASSPPCDCPSRRRSS